MKIAGAPISWGVCEVPGWGFQMNPDRVLSEMVELGLTATEFGPQGWLPVEPEARAAAVKAHGLTPVGAFFLAVMHDPDHDPIPAVKAELEALDLSPEEQAVSPRVPARTIAPMALTILSVRMGFLCCVAAAWQRCGWVMCGGEP